MRFAAGCGVGVRCRLFIESFYIPTLLSKLDAVLIETVDARSQPLKQTRPVIKGRERFFVDKPLASTGIVQECSGGAARSELFVNTAPARTDPLPVVLWATKARHTLTIGDAGSNLRPGDYGSKRNGRPRRP